MVVVNKSAIPVTKYTYWPLSERPPRVVVLISGQAGTSPREDYTQSCDSSMNDRELKCQRAGCYLGTLGRLLAPERSSSIMLGIGDHSPYIIVLYKRSVNGQGNIGRWMVVKEKTSELHIVLYPTQHKLDQHRIQNGIPIFNRVNGFDFAQLICSTAVFSNALLALPLVFKSLWSSSPSSLLRTPPP